MVGKRLINFLFHRPTVDIREVREIREGITSRDFERQPDELRKIDPYCCFVIYYGAEFKLKTLSVAGKHVSCLVYLR